MNLHLRSRKPKVRKMHRFIVAGTHAHRLLTGVGYGEGGLPVSLPDLPSLLALLFMRACVPGLGTTRVLVLCLGV